MEGGGLQDLEVPFKVYLGNYSHVPIRKWDGDARAWVRFLLDDNGSLLFFSCLIMISFDWYVNTTQYTGILNDNKEHNP